jgi:hypothetical protein
VNERSFRSLLFREGTYHREGDVAKDSVKNENTSRWRCFLEIPSQFMRWGVRFSKGEFSVLGMVFSLLA